MTPKNKKIPLKEIEDYIGGYTDALNDYDKGVMTYLLWESQYSIIREDEKYPREDDDSSRLISYMGNLESFKDKDIYSIEISDSCPPCGMSTDTAYEIIRNSGRIFKNHERVLEDI